MRTPSSPPAPPGGWIRRNGGFLACCVLAAGLLFGAYSNHFENGFHFDDSHVIVDNLYLRSLSNAPRFFTDPNTFSTRPENALYRPLLTLSYALDYWAAGGLLPFAFHRTQFLMLVVLGALLVAFYRKLCDSVEPRPENRYVGLLAATLFCVHTANTETVNYLSSRSSLVATTAVVASLWLFLAWPRGRRTYLYLLPVVLGGLAKPLTFMLAPLLAAYLLLIEEGLSPAELLGAAGWRKVASALRGSAPAFVVALAVVAFTTSMDPETVVFSDIGRGRYLLTQPFVWLHYVRLFVLPVGLTADTDWTPVAHVTDTRVVVGVLFVGVLAAAAVRFAAARGLRPAAFGLAWFAIALLPTSSIVPLAEVYNEHRIFFPYVGLTLAAAWLAVAALRRFRARNETMRRVIAGFAAAGAVAILLGHAVGTYQRNLVWKDELSLWEDVARKSPTNPRGLMNYGVALMGAGYTRQALSHFERARVLAPNYEILEINLAVAKSTLGEPGAESHFRRALWLSPGYARGRYFYAEWLVEQGRGIEAIEQLDSALATSAGDLDVRALLARLRAARGDDEGLAEIVRGTLALAPTDAVALAYSTGRDPVAADEETVEAYDDLARRHARAGRWLDSAGSLRRLLALDPGSARGWNDLGWARVKLGFLDEAVVGFDRALEIDPGLDKARSNLEWVRLRRTAGARD